jgi:dipeptidyl aminopeptidase/acylaminoacyl peptidase
MSPDDGDVLEELARLPTMAHPTISPDGTEVALYYDVTGRNELHVLDVESEAQSASDRSSAERSSADHSSGQSPREDGEATERGELAQWSDGEVPRNARWPVTWDADGERVYFHLDEAGNEQNDVHAIGRDGDSEPVVEMDGQAAINDVGPDGDLLLFGSSRDGQMNVYRHDVPTGETTKLTEYERAAGGATVSPDGTRFAFTTNESDDFDNRDVYVADVDGSNVRNLRLGEDGAESAPADWSPDGSRLLVGDNTADLGRVGVYDLDDEATKLTEYERAAGGATVSPDGTRFAFTTNESDDFDNRDVYVADVDGSNVRNLRLGEDGAESAPADWSPDGSRLLVGDNTADLGRVGVYDLDDEAVTWLGDGTYEESPGAFVDDSRIVVSRDRDAVTMPVVYDLESGERRELDLPDGVASVVGGQGRNTLADGRLAVVHTTPTRRPELLAYDLETDEYETLIEAEYGPFDPEDFADATYFTVESDGVPETPQRAVEHDPYETFEIGALLYDSGERPSPLVVNPHGGPRARDSKSFDLYTQVLVARGFSVLQVNYRGSTGRGREFVEELIEDWGGAEQGDVATAAEDVIDRDWIDEDRVVVFGGSYGGYSAYWQAVQYPDLYDASVAWIGLTDLEDMFENTMPHFRTELMEKYLGTPEENPELYEERSPVTHVENVDAPMFVVHGVNDRRVPVSQARIFREALEDAGYEEGETADFEYQELGEEGHASSDQEQKLRMFEALDDFLQRRVGTDVAATADD